VTGTRASHDWRADVDATGPHAQLEAHSIVGCTTTAGYMPSS
jgi:hypothetical protein